MAPESMHIVRPPTPCGQTHEPAAEPEVVGDVETKTIDWAGIVNRIQNGEAAATEELYRIVAKGIRYFLVRHIGAEESDDRLHETFVIVVQAIQRGQVREPEKLLGFIRVIVRRQIAAYIDRRVQDRQNTVDIEVGTSVPDRGCNPEQQLVIRQHAAIFKKVLRELPEREREILVRFYLREESEEQICVEMGLTETQFRLSKSRAKSRFGEIGKRKLKPSVGASLRQTFVRNSA
jgi:RNA polymerase sigma-70 factor (ECF subfamily)